MVIAGEWIRCDDGITRPFVKARVAAKEGLLIPEWFLVDTASDRTVFSTAFLQRLQVPGSPAPPGLSLRGIGGSGAHVAVAAVLEFTREDGSTIRVRGELAAFTDPAASDLSILGRDVLDNFDVITSRRRNAVLLLAGNHPYQVVGV